MYSYVGVVCGVQLCGGGMWCTVMWRWYVVYSYMGVVCGVQLCGGGMWLATVAWELYMVYNYVVCGVQLLGIVSDVQFLWGGITSCVLKLRLGKIRCL